MNERKKVYSFKGFASSNKQLMFMSCYGMVVIVMLWTLYCPSLTSVGSVSCLNPASFPF